MFSLHQGSIPTYYKFFRIFFKLFLLCQKFSILLNARQYVAKIPVCHLKKMYDLQMTRIRKRSSKMAKWTAEDLQAALGAVKEGKPMTKASALYGIPRTTIYRRLRNKKFSSPKLGRSSVFTAEQEEILTDHIIKLQRACSLNSKKVRRLAFDLAEELNLDHNFNREKKEAGQDWLSAFLKRNPEAQVIRNQKTEELHDTNSLNSLSNIDEDPSTSRIDNRYKIEFFKMEVKFLDRSENRNFQSDPSANSSDDMKIGINEHLSDSTKLEETEKVVANSGMKLRVRNKNLPEKDFNKIRTVVKKKTLNFVDKNKFLDQLGKSSQNVIEGKDKDIVKKIPTVQVILKFYF